jgi:hypothetical protein
MLCVFAGAPDARVMPHRSLCACALISILDRTSIDNMNIYGDSGHYLKPRPGLMKPSPTVSFSLIENLEPITHETIKRKIKFP